MAHGSMKPRAGPRGKRSPKGAARQNRTGAGSKNGGTSRTKRGGDLKSRFERCLELARTATLCGDEIAAEGHYQHAEHYFRQMNAGAA